MSHIYDNWERLVAATIKKQQLWELFHSHSRTPSTLSEASSHSEVSFNAESPSINVDMAAGTSSSIVIHMNEELAELQEFLRENSLLYKEDANEVEAPPIPADEYSSSLLYDYLAAVDEIIKLINESNLQSHENKGQAEKMLEQAMARLEVKFQSILTRNTITLDPDRLNQSFSFDESSLDDVSTRAVYNGVELIRSEGVIDLREIGARMIRAGYERECCQAYSHVRWKVLDEYMVSILESDEIFSSTEGFQTFFDNKMKKWTQGIKVVVRCEKRLCEQIFAGGRSEACFVDTAKGSIMKLLNFGKAFATGNRLSPEKLFKILDMYDALAEVLPDFQSLHLKTNEEDSTVCREASGILDGLGKAAVGTLVEFENAVREEASIKPIANGAIHPLARYVMNYAKLVLDYSDSVNTLLENHYHDVESDSHGGNITWDMPVIAQRLLALMSSLESKIEEKSRMYDDNAMQNIFLMNNFFYIVQKVKYSEELKYIVGDNWVREKQEKFRLYAMHYLRASWSKALLCLQDEGICGSSCNASKEALNKRFLNFNACFEEIYRIQTAWKVPNPQLREELRISISEKVIPAYRSFLGRFGSELESGRHAGRYIKYTPEDLENYLLDLFEGTPLILQRVKQIRLKSWTSWLPHQGISLFNQG